MKTNTLNKNKSNIRGAHNRHTKLNGQSYLIRVQTLGPITLADAEPMPQGGAPINIFTTTKLAKALRDLIERGCYA